MTDTDQCPTCGQRPEPDPKRVWNGIVAQATSDAVNIGLAGLLILGFMWVVFAFTGRINPFEYAYLFVGAYVAAIGLDLALIVRSLILAGYPFRSRMLL